MTMQHPALEAGRRRRFAPNLWDALAFGLLFGALILIVHGGQGTLVPLAALNQTPVSLDPAQLPEYALRTTLRMLAAILASLVFTFLYGALAAKSRRAEMVLIPMLDILQSVPVLGFLSFTVVGFMSLFPGKVLGVELAAIFAIFTSQAWNMTFSFYQSLKTVPRDLDEATRSFRLTGWQRFWRLEVPFSMPGLVWNTMMSMSGGWFFVVASEAISVGDTTITLPGVGSYVALAIKEQNLPAVGWAVLAMLAVILIYDQLLFRPLVAWADKFRVETSASGAAPSSWLLSAARRTRLFQRLLRPLGALLSAVPRQRLALQVAVPADARRALSSPLSDKVWLALVLAVTAYCLWTIVTFVATELTLPEVAQAFGLGVLTMLRVIVLIALATLIWVPIGVWIGLRPAWAERVQPMAQFLAAFPANIIFPFAVVAIVRLGLDPDIWLSPLMVLGTQWYILFNVVAGASAFPNDLREAAGTFRIRGWSWWKKVMLPGIFPYYVTGAITASGGSWNASIVAEVASWGDTTLRAHGIGAYIADATAAGDYPRIVLGIAVMSIFVILFNRLLWRPLYVFAGRRLRLD
ncbi:MULTISPECIES: ABC transporter permease subunit [unclassified Xanthobacter]|uniref:ABC transporter permease n=1 Tax=Xanthobacter TaxID=279 RepID=UPI00145D292C|nr:MULTISPECIES: ABC transporter permease subunit [unclassified Xanthobacter]NMN56673.1 NitT/TauT family transport system permease protein [Xanthobacter sp. SG618]UJX45095.1 ABC transporter permease subunit [Xanthobacter sp. YC-JY1]